MTAISRIGAFHPSELFLLQNSVPSDFGTQVHHSSSSPGSSARLGAPPRRSPAEVHAAPGTQRRGGHPRVALEQLLEATNTAVLLGAGLLW